LDLFAASVWITPSSWASALCVVLSRRTFPITTAGARICRSAKTPRNSDERRPAPKVRWSKFVKSVDYTITTNVGPPNEIDHTCTGSNPREDPPRPRRRGAQTLAFGHRRMASSPFGSHRQITTASRPTDDFQFLLVTVYESRPPVRHDPRNTHGLQATPPYCTTVRIPDHTQRMEWMHYSDRCNRWPQPSAVITLCFTEIPPDAQHDDFSVEMPPP
jgi:hypothetical protein